MSGRAAVLARLAAQGRPAALPEGWESRRDFPDPVARFCAALGAVKGQALVAGSLAAAFERVDAVLREAGARQVAVNDEAPLDLLAPPPGAGWRLERPSAHPAAWREVCAGADAGITSADVLLAETGSLAVSSGPGKSRLTSLLPPLHIAVAPLTRMTTDLFTWLEGRSGEWPANLVLVSGPSKTADIEQTMAVGVHGPGRLVVILYEE